MPPRTPRPWRWTAPPDLLCTRFRPPAPTRWSSRPRSRRRRSPSPPAPSPFSSNSPALLSGPRGVNPPKSGTLLRLTPRGRRALTHLGARAPATGTKHRVNPADQSCPVMPDHLLSHVEREPVGGGDIVEFLSILVQCGAGVELESLVLAADPVFRPTEIDPATPTGRGVDPHLRCRRRQASIEKYPAQPRF